MAKKKTARLVPLTLNGANLELGITQASGPQPLGPGLIRVRGLLRTGPQGKLA